MKNNYRSIIIQILLMFSIMLAILAVFLKYVILDKNTYLNILNEKGAYEQTKDYLYVKIDNMLSSKNINIDIKESIITEDDIKNEADNLISGFIQYLETGKNNIKPIDVELYKQRVKDIIGKVIKPTNNELSFNSNLQIQNTAGQVNKLEYSNMMVYKEQSKVGQSSIKVQRLMTQSEAEAKVRELLKQKGLTEEQAIEKATKKGITEEQALKILAGYGITIDEEPNLGGNKSVTESSDKINGSTNSSKKDSNNTTGNSSEEASSNSQVETAANNNPADKSIKNK
jgi:predicted RND superfamily exporter protein